MLNYFQGYTSVRLLSYNQHREENTEIKIINNKIVLNDIEFIDDIVLNDSQKVKISNIISKYDEPGTLADCYFPRHIFLFYQGKKLIGYYELCLDCGGSKASNNIHIPSISSEKGVLLLKLFKQMKLKNYGEEGVDYQYF